RRMNIIEERGTGIDKTVTAIELFQLPAPDFLATPSHTKAFLFAPRPLGAMDKQDRVRACYQHACLKWLANDRMSNATLRARLDIPKTNYPLATRIINASIEEGLIRQSDIGSNSLRNR